MLKYTVVGSLGLLLEKHPVKLSGGKLLLEVPVDSTVWVNGTEYTASDGVVRVNAKHLRAINTVRIRDSVASRRADGFTWDGTYATPLSGSTDEIIAALVRELAETVTRVSKSEQTLSQLKEQVERPLFRCSDR